VGEIADRLLGKGAGQLDGFGLELLRVTRPRLLRHVDPFSGGFASQLSGVHQTGSSPVTHSRALTMGIAKVPPGEALREHRHRQAEIYLVLEGTGSITIDGETRPVSAGSAVFIPGNALHSCESTGSSDLRFSYVFAADSFEEVEYVFDE